MVAPSPYFQHLCFASSVVMGDFDSRSTPIQDVLTSAFAGALLSFMFYLLSEATGAMDYLLLRSGLSGIGGRLGDVQFVIFGAILRVVGDLLGKLKKLRS